MTPWTERFANQLIKDYEGHGAFDVDLGSFADAADIAFVMRANGHKVSVDRFNNRLLITPETRTVAS